MPKNAPIWNINEVLPPVLRHLPALSASSLMSAVSAPEVLLKTYS